MWAARVESADRIYFPAVEDARRPILALLNNETQRIDIASWEFSDHTLSQTVVARWRSGVPVRVIGDLLAYRNYGTTKTEFDYLASQGVPIRFRANPSGSTQIVHWKAGIFAGLNTVEFGSANWTPYELRPASSTDYDDETALVTDDPPVVGALKTQFDLMWTDTENFIDWANVQPGSAVRLEPDYPMPPYLGWSQGDDYNARVVDAIDAETGALDIVLYRITSAVVTDALIQRARPPESECARLSIPRSTTTPAIRRRAPGSTRCGLPRSRFASAFTPASRT